MTGAMPAHAKIVVRIAGGLGNQLFTYAAARRLSLVSGAELVLDDETGFTHDRVYRRRYGLDAFSISARTATSAEKLKPFERLRRKLMRSRSMSVPFEKRSYVTQEGLDFDPRLLQFRPKGTIFLEGYWTSEGYFADVADTIRRDLRLTRSLGSADRSVEARIRNSVAVALHVRWFDAPGTVSRQNAPIDYYRRAVELIASRVSRPHYFVFSDNPEAVREHIPLPADSVTFVDHNDPDTLAHADLWLMSQCDHFIISNSTFSWWGGWLGMNPGKIVIAPSATTVAAPAWALRGLIPDGWLKI